MAVLAARRVLFDVWGGIAEVCARADTADDAVALVRDVVEDVDRTCSPFRSDSDLSIVNARAGTWTQVDPLFAEILTRTLELAAATRAALDPTVGTRTLAATVSSPPSRADHRLVRVRGDRVHIPAGMRLDLNSTAKAWAADRAAAHAAEVTRTGVLVGLCGDFAVAGQSDGWDVECGDDHRDPQPGPASGVHLYDGGLATSSLTVRRTTNGNHVVDPSTLRPVTGPWRTVSVVASSCLQANAAATACLVMGTAAVPWLESLGLPARLVRVDGQVHTTEGWPS